MNDFSYLNVNFIVNEKKKEIEYFTFKMYKAECVKKDDHVRVNCVQHILHTNKGEKYQIISLRFTYDKRIIFIFVTLPFPS